jgi:hypothetical protein
MIEDEEDSQHEIGVDGRHRIVGHYTESAVETLEPVRRKRLDDIGHAEEEKPDERAAPSDRIHEQGDERPDDFVDDHVPWIGAAEMTFAGTGAPDTSREDYDDRRDLNAR